MAAVGSSIGFCGRETGWQLWHCTRSKIPSHGQRYVLIVWGALQSGKDRVLSLANRASAVDAITELIWNSLDAEATSVEVSASINEFGAPTELVVTDNGHGIAAHRAWSLFLTEGDSWKKDKRFSDSLRRPLHGQMGRGRLITYSVAERVEWSSVSSTQGGPQRIVIRGTRESPNGFDILDPEDVNEPAGTTVLLTLRDIQKAAKIADEGFEQGVVERLAESLISLRGVAVRWRGRLLDPERAIRSHDEVPLTGIEPDVLHGYPSPTLTVIEWNRPFGSKEIILCDDAGSAITNHRPSGLPAVPFSWSAYLRWSGFRDPELMGVADLHVPKIRHPDILSATERALTKYLAARFATERGRIVQVWKEEGVYPYLNEPDSQLATAERNLFDVVAVLASSAIPTTGKAQKRLSLQLLRAALRAEPSRLGTALEGVLSLPEDELKSLEFLLKRTELGSLIRSAHRVANRLDFLAGLSSILYTDKTARVFREVDQLHPILIREPWLFGDEWDSSLSEHGLTKVVRTAVEASGEAILALKPVRLESGKGGRVDMLFHRHIYESQLTRHLVVELKRPAKLDMTHFSQVANYAQAITDHPEVAKSPHKWDFWLVGTDMEATVNAQRQNDNSQPGLVRDYGAYRLFVITWGELLDQLRHKLEWYREELAISPTEATGLAYLEKSHQEFLPNATND